MTLPSFRYRLEQQAPKAFNGGVTRGASVVEFPVSTGIAGVSMRLGPGTDSRAALACQRRGMGLRCRGSCRTTILHPDGSAYIDTFDAGDVWYFPRGYGHSIQGLGPGECHFILIFDNGDFSEDHTFSITDFLAQTPREVVAQSLGLSIAELAPLPKREAYFVRGPVPDDSSLISTPRRFPQLTTLHRYPLEAQQPRRVPRRRNAADRNRGRISDFNDDGRVGHRVAAWSAARVALASERGRVAVLHERHGRDGRVSGRREMPSSISSKLVMSAMLRWERATTSRTPAPTYAAFSWGLTARTIRRWTSASGSRGIRWTCSRRTLD